MILLIIGISLVVGGGYIYGLYNPSQQQKRLILVPFCIVPILVITSLMIPKIIRTIRDGKTKTTDFLNITEKFCGVLSYEVAERLHKTFGGDK